MRRPPVTQVARWPAARCLGDARGRAPTCPRHGTGLESDERMLRVRVGIASGIVAMIVMGLRWVDPNPEARFVGGFAFGASLAWLGLLAATSRPLAPPVREATTRETVCLLAVVTGASVAVLLVLRIDAVATHALLSGVALAGWGTALVLAGVTTVALARGRLPGLGARESTESG